MEKYKKLFEQKKKVVPFTSRWALSSPIVISSNLHLVITTKTPNFQRESYFFHICIYPIFPIGISSLISFLINLIISTFVIKLLYLLKYIMNPVKNFLFPFYNCKTNAKYIP